MKKLASLIIALLAFVSVQNLNAQTKAKKEKLPLENEVYTAEITPASTDNKAPSKGKPDQVTFRGGKVKSDYFDEKGGFKAANYTVTKDSVDADEDRYVEFETLLKNENEEEVEIKGTVIGNDLEGTAKWSKDGKLKKEFTFFGTIKKK